MLQIVKANKNPQMAMQNLMNSNPQMKQVVDFVNKSGGDPQKAFYELAKQRGVNPDDILKMLN